MRTLFFIYVLLNFVLDQSLGGLPSSKISRVS